MRTIENTLSLQKGTYFTIKSGLLHDLNIALFDKYEYEDTDEVSLMVVLEPTARFNGLNSNIFNVLFQRHTTEDLKEKLEYALFHPKVFSSENNSGDYQSNSRQNSPSNGGVRPAWNTCISVVYLEYLLNEIDFRYVRNPKAKESLKNLSRNIRTLVVNHYHPEEPAPEVYRENLPPVNSKDYWENLPMELTEMNLELTECMLDIQESLLQEKTEALEEKESQIDSLLEEKFALEEKYEEVRSLAKSRRIEIATLSSLLSSSESTLKEEREIAEREIEDLSRKLSLFKKKVSELKTQLQADKSSIDTLTSSLDEERKENLELRAKLDKYRSISGRRKQKIKELETSLKTKETNEKRYFKVRNARRNMRDTFQTLFPDLGLEKTPLEELPAVFYSLWSECSEILIKGLTPMLESNSLNEESVCVAINLLGKSYTPKDLCQMLKDFQERSPKKGEKEPLPIIESIEKDSEVEDPEYTSQ